MGELGRQKALNEFDDRKIAADIYTQVELILNQKTAK